jgi:hypothetical protein
VKDQNQRAKSPDVQPGATVFHLPGAIFLMVMCVMTVVRVLVILTQTSEHFAWLR